MEKTELSNSEHFHRIVNCQWACPAHTNVPEYIRLISSGRYSDSYLINWRDNVFPGILGRTCDRPCEPACRRARVDETPVAICRLKRAAADYKETIRFPEPPAKKNGKKVALIGAGPASLTVARDLAVQGYEIDLFEKDVKAGGAMRYQIPSFRLPESVLNEETDRILNMGIKAHFGSEVKSLKAILDKKYDAVFVGSGAPKGQDLEAPGRKEAASAITIGIQWLANVAFGHVTKVGKKVLVIGGGNTAMDCCRTALRLGGTDVKVVVRSGFEEMKASPWEKEDAMKEGVQIFNYHLPKEFVVEGGKLKGMKFEKVEKKIDEKGRRQLIPTGEPPVFFEADEVLLAIGQDTAFPWIESDIGIKFDEWNRPVVDPVTFMSTVKGVFFGGDAINPKNIITAVAHGHAAAISIDALLSGKDMIKDRPMEGVNLVSQKMGLHDWIYHNEYSDDKRQIVPHADLKEALKSVKKEVELGYDKLLSAREASRCLNCDVQTIFNEKICIECDACADICPVECINFMENGDEADVRERTRIPARNKEQPLYISGVLKTGKVMIKDEDLCLHCAMCAERCPTSAWDMQKFTLGKFEKVKV